MTERRIDWIATVGCEGGPVMVVDYDGLSQWTGALPFTALRRDEPDSPRLADRRRVLHFWGNLGGAGEQFVECDSEAEALGRLDRLRAMAQANCPGVVITEDDRQTHFRDPASGGELRAELEPASEYDASWQAHPDDQGWVHAFGDEVRAFFWSLRGGALVHVGRSDARDELILMTHTVGALETRAEDNAAARALVAVRSADETSVAEVDLASGRIVVLWSPVAAREIEGFDPRAAVDAAAPSRLDIDVAKGVGTVLHVTAGRYAAAVGAVPRSDDGTRAWSARWCRLTRPG